MSSILISRSRSVRALAAALSVVALAACNDDQPTAPLAIASDASAALVVPGPGITCAPRCTPIGRILYVRGDTLVKFNGHLWVMNGDSTGKTQITFGAGDDDLPAWSPDYKKVVFQTNRRGPWELFTVNVDGTGMTPLTTSVNGSRDDDPSWAPDGSKIYFARTVADTAPMYWRSQIYSINPDGTGLTKVSNDPGNLYEPTVSPDGKKIAVTRNTKPSADGAHIYTMNTNGTGMAQLTDGWTGDGSPAWSADGKKLVFVCSFGFPDYRDICTVNADGTGRTKIVATAGGQEHPSFSRDGSRVIYVDFGSSNDWGVLVSVKPDGTNALQYEASPSTKAYYSPTWSR